MAGYKGSKVMILREAITKVTQILVGQRIEVHQRGMEARVEYDKSTGLPKAVYLPMLPENASDELCDAIQGFLDAEVGSVLHTDPSVNGKAKRYGDELHAIWKMVESTFVERKQSEMYRGSGSNLETVGRFYLNKYVDPKLKEARAMKNDQAEVGVLMPVTIRALAGQLDFSDYLKKAKSDPMDTIVAKLIGMEPQLRSISNSNESLEAALEIMRRLKDEEPQEGDGEGDDDEGEGEGKQQKSKGKKGEKSKGQKGKGDESGEGGESDEADDQDGDDEGEGQGESDEGEGDEEGEGQSGKGKGEPGDDEGEGDGEGDGEGEGEGEGDGEEAEAQAGDGPATARTSNDTPDGAKQKPKDQNDVKPDSGNLGKTQKSGLSWNEIAKEMKSAKNVDEATADALGAEAVKAAKKADYIVYTTENDKIEPLEVPAHRHDHFVKSCADNIEAPVSQMINPMQKDLERIIAARSLSVYTGGHKSGRLHSAGLMRLKFNDDRVFRRKQENQTKDVAVSLVIDVSGSMSGGKVLTATRAAFALSQVLERLRIKHEVVCFTTSSDYASRYSAPRTNGVAYSRVEGINMPIIKTFDEPVNSTVRARFGAMPSEIGMSSNIDGESVEYAARRLLKRKAARHVMIVLSDGQPACYSMDGGDGVVNDLSRRVKMLEQGGVDIVGIGIMSNAVAQFYSKHVVLNDVSKLPTEVMGQLKTMLVPK